MPESSPQPKMFPIQNYHRREAQRPHPIEIPWSVAELAYSEYSRRYGRGQTLQGLADRGGFDAAEMDEFCPDWRERSSEITALRKEISDARAGKCATIIPGSFIACGEGGNYCSEVCHARAILSAEPNESLAEAIKRALLRKPFDASKLFFKSEGSSL